VPVVTAAGSSSSSRCRVLGGIYLACSPPEPGDGGLACSGLEEPGASTHPATHHHPPGPALRRTLDPLTEPLVVEGKGRRNDLYIFNNPMKMFCVGLL